MAQRPAAVKLFPKTTLAYVAVADTHDLRERLKQTGMGQMSADPQLRPLVDGLYGSLGTALKEVEQRAGASLGEMLEIPDGEFAVCMVPQENAPPAVVALIDAGDHVPQMTKLLEHARSQLTENGGEDRAE